MGQNLFSKVLIPNFPALFGMQPLVHSRDPTTMRHRQGLSLASSSESWDGPKLFSKDLIKCSSSIRHATSCSLEGSNNNAASTRDFVGMIRELGRAFERFALALFSNRHPWCFLLELGIRPFLRQDSRYPSSGWSWTFAPFSGRTWS